MKQTEKKDLILRYLYEKKDDNKEYNLRSILDENQVETSVMEVSRIADDLGMDKFIYLNNLSTKLKKGKITSKGIDYCEADSYTNKGQSIINNYNIINSPQSNIIANSNQVTINQTTHDKAASIINDIKEELIKGESFELEFKREVLECLSEIQNGIANKKAPKFALRSLLSMVGDTSSISGLVLSLVQLLGGG
ncbi:hypothetical protein [Reichenbachiella sp. MALMAid0571]|uniref:hypothetical protein n=1 Tax=Reichenbachiella sp. MALMAid0571 TaxID=3143939 RepID=UPI0032DFB3DD